MTPRELNDGTLAHHAARVAVPTYDRASLTPAVVHMSVGNFHRSHQAVYFDELAQRRITTRWGLVGVGRRDRRLLDALTPQDNLYTLVERGADRDRARVIGVMRRYLYAPADRRAVVDALADERTRLVTLTITRSAYHVDASTGAFDAAHPDVAADLRSPSVPGSALGFLVEALDRRRRAGLPGFTVLSCDNMPASGRVTRTAVVSFAAHRDPALARWIESAASFPSSMVDRITPRTTEEDRRRLAGQFGVADRWPVVTEPFSQWVVEDAFCNGRPPLDEVGVRFVPDVEPYATTKTRLLNASHCALGHLGYLAGHRGTDEAMDDPIFSAYVADLMSREIAPLLPAVPGIDLREYRQTLLRRLANRRIPDQLERLCRAGSAKIPVHVLPSLVHARAEGRPCALLTLAVAGWCRYLRAVDMHGRPYALDDPLAGRLQPLALVGGTDPRPLLSQRHVFGDLADDAGFVSALEDVLRMIDLAGVRAAVQDALGSKLAVAAS